MANHLVHALLYLNSYIPKLKHMIQLALLQATSMSSSATAASTLSLLLFFLFMTSPTSSLNQDGHLLLSFKYSVHSDPTSALSNWNHTHRTPCSWTGVTCTASRVTSLLLPNRRLLGSLPYELPTIPLLRRLDLSNNSLIGALPPSLFSSPALRTLSLAHNDISGTIPEASGNATGIRYLNLSSNRLSGAIPSGLPTIMPEDVVLDFSFNNLTGTIPDAPLFLSQNPSAFAGNADLHGKPLRPEPPPAFAVMPTKERNTQGGGLKPATIAAIAAGDLGAIGLLVSAVLYVYRVKKRRRTETDSSDLETEWEEEGETAAATLVTVDGDAELDMETLLKSSAYVLGTMGPTIVYKAVLSDGTTLAVRRIGECMAFENLDDFEAQVRSIAKLRHPNLLRCRGFYWGPDEKLLIHDYAPNGSLASKNSCFGWETRLRIARGVARGLAYVHEKKHVHGNVKPSNILLGSDTEAKIGDLGLDRLLSSTSGMIFGSARSMRSQSSLPESSPGAALPSLPYRAPESLKSLKANTKWDVYSFGVVLLELITGRVFTEEELDRWNVVEERNRILRTVDPSVRGELEGKEAAVVSCFKLGLACAAVAPQRRPTMKDVAMLLDKIIRNKNGI